MKSFRIAISFLAGLFMVIVGVLGDCPRFWQVIVGLLLMGTFTVPETIALLKGRIRDEQ